MVQIIEGGRGGKLLVHLGHRSQRNKVRTTGIYWRCCAQQCACTLKTNVFDIGFADNRINVINIGNHNHPPPQDGISRQIVVNRIKAVILEDPTIPIKRAYDETVARIQRDAAIPPEGIPEFHNIRAQLQWAKAINMPPIPVIVDDVVIDGVWAETWRGVRNLIAIDNDWGIVLFGTDADLRLLRESRTIFLDGTFRSAPRPYTQLFTIHGVQQGRALNFVSCLMTDRNIGSYRQVFQILKREIRRITHHRWRPLNAVMDFELATISAFETEFQNGIVMGCYFHYNQALWRNIQRLALGFLPLMLVRIITNYAIPGELYGWSEGIQTWRSFLHILKIITFTAISHSDYGTSSIVRWNFEPIIWLNPTIVDGMPPSVFTILPCGYLFGSSKINMPSMRLPLKE